MNRKLISLTQKTYSKLMDIKHKIEKEEQKVLSFDEVIQYLILKNKKPETVDELIDFVLEFVYKKTNVDFEERQKLLREIIKELVNEYSGIDDTVIQIKATIIPAYAEQEIAEITIFKDEETLKLLKEMEEEKQEEN